MISGYLHYMILDYLYSRSVLSAQVWRMLYPMSCSCSELYSEFTIDNSNTNMSHKAYRNRYLIDKQEIQALVLKKLFSIHDLLTDRVCRR
ncbi:hypothetical protein C8R28_101444 [Nitrosomonas ureae]|uniref:Uncharacterized protein n=1 Tax=Nitrosomonas ureae TaxID=44577 RepID=A0A2T5INC2_9PROT|nr:hypothetical protein C8R28_101444 [Nitrosomonas ureae]